MRLITINPVAQQRLAVAVPIIALGLSLFVVYPAWGRYRELGQDNEKKAGELRRLNETAPPNPGHVSPAWDANSTEPPQFMGIIRAMAEKSGCFIASFDSTGSGETKEEGPVRSVRARLDLIGSYAQIRSFIWKLSHSDRLYVLTDLSIGNSTSHAGKSLAPGLVRASLNIERYVTAPANTKTPPSS